MKIMVFDVPAVHGGALSVLEEFYKKAINNPDKTVEWIFVVSKPVLKENKNVKILRFPWVKKSWLHRLFFDYVIAPKLVRKHNVNQVLSLQNIIIPRVSPLVKQSVYIHQSLPFVDYKFKLRESKLFWFYQNVISRLIIKSMKKADHIIVQTNWMKKASIKKSKENERKFEVRPPEISIEVRGVYKQNNESMRTFFYPAGSGYYKNHRIIINACSRLVGEGISDFKVIFTLNGDENQHIIDLKEQINKKNLPVFFKGMISREKVFEYYTKSILLFPSYVESSPLPLTEAKMHESIILASNCNFSMEILANYKKAYFFNWDNEVELVELMKKYIQVLID